MFLKFTFSPNISPVLSSSLNLVQAVKITFVRFAFINLIVIGILLVCFLVCSYVVALNWELMDHAFVQAPDISSSETIDPKETVQESTQKNKDIKQKISKKKKKKSKKKTIESPVYTYVLNTNTGRFHTEDCYYVDTIAEHNK